MAPEHSQQYTELIYQKHSYNLIKRFIERKNRKEEEFLKTLDVKILENIAKNIESFI